MLKPLVLGATLLCAHTVDVEAYSRYRNRAWCGSYIAKYFGISDPRLAVARMWASVGANAGGPAIGAIVVWSHHVGVITGRTAEVSGLSMAEMTAAPFERGLVQ